MSPLTTPAPRRAGRAPTWGLTLGMIAAVLSSAGCAGELDIVHGLTEFEANQILVVLGSQGIDAMKLKEEGRIVTWAIVVPDSDSQRALTLLVKNKLPKTRAQGLAEVYPAGSSGLIPTKSEEKAKFMMAVQGELERKLKTLPGVQEAHVSVVSPDKDVIRDLDTPPPPATASVAIVFNPEKNGKPPIDPSSVQKLIAAAVEELKPENVEVFLKENEPMRLVGLEGEVASNVQVAGETVLGIKVVSKKAGTRAKGILGLSGGLAIMGLLLGIIGIVRSVSLKGKLSKAEAEVAALKKARRELPE
jgi:type III secretion system YscJ/HrcJ family lipoprotein